MVRFLCKEMWHVLFKKQVDALKTNNKGIFVITDGQFRWLSKMSGMRKDAGAGGGGGSSAGPGAMLARPSGPGAGGTVAGAGAAGAGAARSAAGTGAPTAGREEGTDPTPSAATTPHAEVGKLAHPHLAYHCGLIRGVLANLGLEAAVVAEVLQAPQVAFQLKLKQ
jgi:hypothetical protein